MFQDKVSRKDEDGNVIWRPTMKSGEYAEPYRLKPFGSTKVIDRESGELVPCTPQRCPKAEKVPPYGHHRGEDDRANVLPRSELEGKLINRAPFFWSGGLGTLIRKSAKKERKDLLWDFFVYANSPAASVYDVANYASWLDSWRISQLLPGDNFLKAGWSEDAYHEHQSTMLWGSSNTVNAAYNLRIPGLAKYTRDVVGANAKKYFDGSMSLDQLAAEVATGWEEITLQEGKLGQLEIYRAALGFDALSEFNLCQLHRGLMDEQDPSACVKYDSSTRYYIAAIIVPIVVVLLAVLVVFHLDSKRRSADGVWKIQSSELKFASPPTVLGRGTFGLVVSAEYRGTQVAVKRVIPSNESSSAGPFSVECKQSTSSPAAESATLQSFFAVQNSIVNFIDEAEKGNAPRRTMGLFSRQILVSSGLQTQLRADFVAEMRQMSKLRHPCVTTVGVISHLPCARILTR